MSEMEYSIRLEHLENQFQATVAEINKQLSELFNSLHGMREHIDRIEKQIFEQEARPEKIKSIAWPLGDGSEGC